MNKLFALFLLWPLVALADTPPLNAPPTTQPQSTGTAHVCGQKYYPPEAIRLGQEGTTLIIFRISVEGHPEDIYVAKSSGSFALDYAAVTCARNWLYKPALMNGNPIEVPWAARVTWELNNYLRTPLPPTSIGAPHVCTGGPRASAENLSPTVLSFVISPTGNVTALNLVRSSGDNALDQYGITCVSTWQFEPAKSGDQPVGVGSFVTLNWSTTQSPPPK